MGDSCSGSDSFDRSVVDPVSFSFVARRDSFLLPHQEWLLACPAPDGGIFIPRVLLHSLAQFKGSRHQRNRSQDSLRLLAMLGAVYFLYRTASELFTREIAITVAVVFCRPSNRVLRGNRCSPLCVRGAGNLRDDVYPCPPTPQFVPRIGRSLWRIYRNYCLLSTLVCSDISRPRHKLRLFEEHQQRVPWRQLAIATGAFCVAFIPVIPGILYMSHSSGTHPFHEAPTLLDLFMTFCPFPLLVSLGFALIIIALRTPPQKTGWHWDHEWWRLLFCCSLALIPLLILFGVSALTPLHIFVTRYRLVAIPGFGAVLRVRHQKDRARRICVVRFAIPCHSHGSLFVGFSAMERTWLHLEICH